MDKPIAKLGSILKVATLVVALSPGAIWAAETTSAIRGKLIGANGNPLTNTTVLVVDTRTGISREFTSNDAGSFLANRLPVGGPYNVTVNGKTTVVPSLRLGDIFNLTLDNRQAMEEVIAYGDASKLFKVAAGPSATFSSYDIESAVAFDSDIKDIYTIDPRISLDADGDSINCAGKHPRFNSITLDGVSQDDLFGLNNNGYSTAVGQPFPLAAVAQVSVELAPFDVTYGGFTACNINAVTKSGTNEWTGSVFYEYSSDDLRGDSIDGLGDQSGASYNKKKYGFSIGGPLIEDKLFLFATYEESSDPRFLAQSHADGGANSRPWLSKSDFDRIQSIAQNVYNYDAGGTPGDGVEEEEKYVIRLDYNINDDHTATLIYNYYDGFQDRSSDSDSNEFEFSNHYYTKGALQKTYISKLASQWTDAFSTEIYYSSSEVVDSQVTKGPKDFGDFQISINRDTVYLGADDSRQANALNYDSTFFRLAGNYLIGDHIITAGYERNKLDVFNLFVQHSRGGEYDFFDDSGSNSAACNSLTAAGRFADNSCGLSGIDKFELGRPSRIYYGSGGGTNVAADASASFVNIQETLYIQDEWYLSDYDLTLVFGLRHERFSTDDSPVFNQNFTNTVGVRNDETIDGLSLTMPRFGFKWEPRSDLSVRGGIGLYSGGNPNVWISNSYSNDGITNVQKRLNNFNSALSVLDGSIALVGNGQPGRAVPQSLFDQVAGTSVANGSDEDLAIIDPDYEQPAELKIALGATYDLPWYEIVMEADILYSRQRDPAQYVDVSQSIDTTKGVNGYTTLGLPIYSYTRGEDNFMLTNSSDEGKSLTISTTFTKDFDFGLELLVGYAYTDAEDVSPMTSSTAGSNFSNVSTNDINNPGAGTSNYQTEHRFTMRAVWSKELFDGLKTRVTLYGTASEGQPQSYVMGSGDQEGNGFFGRHLLYVPEANDPNVVFDPAFDIKGFYAFVNKERLGSGLQKRNENNSEWAYRLDLGVSQELPTFVEGVKGKVFLKMYNFTNFLNDDWGQSKDAEFFSVQVVDSDINAQGQYVFTQFNGDGDITQIREDRSLWEVRIGLNFSF